MPATAAYIDDLRAAFGADNINPSIKAGMEGQPTFWARENGQEIGTRAASCPEKTISLSQCQIGPFNPANAPQTKQKGQRHG